MRPRAWQVSRLLSLAAIGTLSAAPSAAGIAPAGARLSVARTARQLVVVSGATTAPHGPQRLATLRAYARAAPTAPWRLVLGPWTVETGAGGMVPAARRREGDRATPIGVFAFAHMVYGNRPNPGGLRYPYHRLRCGDWWDEDPASPRYNRFVHVRCGVTPGFATGSEALWTERVAYPYLIPVAFNTDPIRRGRQAPGSGIFVHSWVGSATAGCIALPRSRLVRLLRWLAPGRAPEIAIGTARELASISGG